jgi:hypothetical protein
MQHNKYEYDNHIIPKFTLSSRTYRTDAKLFRTRAKKDNPINGLSVNYTHFVNPSHSELT